MRKRLPYELKKGEEEGLLKLKVVVVADHKIYCKLTSKQTTLYPPTTHGMPIAQKSAFGHCCGQ